jgi:DNA polymerase-3 subunit alpha
MEILMNPQVTNADLTYANKARKIIAKKKMDEVEGFKNTFFEKGLENNCRQVFLEYIWDTTIKPQLGYSFSRNHTVPYSFIALQELNLYQRFPSIYWNTACLTVNAGSMEIDEDDAQKSTNYAKMAIAIGDIQKQGLSVSLADINRSSFSFKPDSIKNEIIFGLKGVANVGDDLIDEIIKNRPYTSIEDFLNKVKIMVYKFKRFTQKVAIGMLRMVDPSKYEAPKNEYEIEALAICKKLASKKSSTLLISPISGKRYIKSDDNQIYIIIEGHLVNIVNHSYSYVIPVEGKSHERLIRMFDIEVERRREIMETEIRSNIKHSLSTIYKNLVNEQI